MTDLFMRGGPLMWPLLLLSVAALAIILERAITYLSIGLSRRKSGRLTKAVESGNTSEIISIAEKERNPVSAMVRLIFSHRDLPREEIEHKVSLEGSRIIKSLSRYLHLLELIGKISPMLGLSGTILGLARTFQAVSEVRGAADPTVLADGIWSAMITTVTGLFIAIPAIIFYHLYRNRVASVSFTMKNEAEELIAQLKGGKSG